jgi:hypothetical protein
MSASLWAPIDGQDASFSMLSRKVTYDLLLLSTGPVLTSPGAAFHLEGVFEQVTDLPLYVGDHIGDATGPGPCGDRLVTPRDVP